jgi:hypothetical protein
MKLNNKIDKVDDNLVIHRYDNGFMVQIGGKRDDEWSTCKIMCSSLKEVFDILEEYNKMEIEA